MTNSLHGANGADGPNEVREPRRLSPPEDTEVENELAPLSDESGIPDIATEGGSRLSAKGLLAITLLAITLVAAAVMAVQRMANGFHRPSNPDSALNRDKPSAAGAAPHRLEISETKPLVGSPSSTPLIPALRPIAQDDEGNADPISVRRAGTSTPSATSARLTLPEDAPVLLTSTHVGTSKPSAGERVEDGHPGVSSGDASLGVRNASDPMTATTSNLRDYQRRLQGLMDSLTQSAALTSTQANSLRSTGSLLSAEPPMERQPVGAVSGTSGLFGDQLQPSSTPAVRATMLKDRSLTLPKGTTFTCALKTKVISASSGLVGCVLQRNLFGDDGRVLLAERGSHLDGEYRVTSLKPGTVRIPIVWTRLRTPLGVTVDLGSPGTGQLGESGIDGYVDNRWAERIGAAMLLSLIDDSVKLIIQNQANERQADTVVLPSTTANTSKLAEKVLDSTINIPPLIYQNQGGIVGIYVARDVDFSSVYTLEPTSPNADAAVKR